MFFKMALRDVAFIALGVLVWLQAARFSAGSGLLADGTGLVLGLWIGLCGYLAHEWGHLAGALATRSRVEAPLSLASGFLFSFDSKTNDRRQFLAMSFAGFAATGLVLWAFYTFLPEGLLATRVARGVAVFSTLLTIVIEVPLVFWSLLGRGLPPVENSVHKARLAAARAAEGSRGGGSGPAATANGATRDEAA